VGADEGQAAGGWLNHAEVGRLAQAFGKYRICPKTTLVVKTSIGKGHAEWRYTRDHKTRHNAVGSWATGDPDGEERLEEIRTRSVSWSVNSARGSIH
jgi:hypothetical protein